MNEIKKACQEVIEINRPIKSWWAGDQRVEKYMHKVSEAILRHTPRDNKSYTDIYNRAYEAVYQAIKDYDKGE